MTPEVGRALLFAVDALDGLGLRLDESIGGNDVSERLERALAQNKPKTPRGKRKRARGA